MILFIFPYRFVITIEWRTCTYVALPFRMKQKYSSNYLRSLCLFRSHFQAKNIFAALVLNSFTLIFAG